MIALSDLKARARAEHPDASLAYLPAQKGHLTVFGRRFPSVQHAGVRAQHDDVEHFFWANGDVTLRCASICASVYTPRGQDPHACLYPMGVCPPVSRPTWTEAQRRTLAPPPVPCDLPAWEDAL